MHFFQRNFFTSSQITIQIVADSFVVWKIHFTYSEVTNIGIHNSSTNTDQFSQYCVQHEKKTVWLNFIFISLTTADSLVAIKNEIISKYARLFLPFFDGGVLLFSHLNFSLCLPIFLSHSLFHDQNSNNSIFFIIDKFSIFQLLSNLILFRKC